MRLLYVLFFSFPLLLNSMYCSKEEVAEIFFKAVITQDHEKITSMLSENAALVYIRDRNERTPLMYAARKGDKRIIESLLNAYKKITTRKQRKESHELLLAMDKNGRTALSDAAFSGHTNVIRLLLTKNIINLPDQLDYVAPSGFSELDPLLNTPLMYATMCRHANTVRLLLRYHANPDIPNYRGMTPLAYAAEMGFNEVIPDLIQAGANINTQDEKGRTPVMHSIIHQRYSTLECLLRYNPHLTAQDDHNLTAIEHCHLRNLPQFLILLKNHLLQQWQ